MILLLCINSVVGFIASTVSMFYYRAWILRLAIICIAIHLAIVTFGKF